MNLRTMLLVTAVGLGVGCGTAAPHVRVEGQRFLAQEGKSVHASLVHLGFNEIVDQWVVSIQNGRFNTPWETVVPGVAYRIDVFVDTNENGRCDFEPNGDLVFSGNWEPMKADELGAGFVFIGDEANPPYDSTGCLSYGGGSAEMKGTGFMPDQSLKAALVRVSDGAVIDRKGTITQGGSFSIKFPGALQPATFYRVDYYVDLNFSERCDAPPTDQVWRYVSGAYGEAHVQGLAGGGFTVEVNPGDAMNSSACQSHEGATKYGPQ
jgi:hypothetical protein